MSSGQAHSTSPPTIPRTFLELFYLQKVLTSIYLANRHKIVGIKMAKKEGQGLREVSRMDLASRNRIA